MLVSLEMGGQFGNTLVKIPTCTAGLPVSVLLACKSATILLFFSVLIMYL